MEIWDVLAMVLIAVTIIFTVILIPILISIRKKLKSLKFTIENAENNTKELIHNTEHKAGDLESALKLISKFINKKSLKNKQRKYSKKTEAKEPQYTDYKKIQSKDEMYQLYYGNGHK